MEGYLCVAWSIESQVVSVYVITAGTMALGHALSIPTRSCSPENCYRQFNVGM